MVCRSELIASLFQPRVGVIKEPESTKQSKLSDSLSAPPTKAAFTKLSALTKILEGVTAI